MSRDFSRGSTGSRQPRPSPLSQVQSSQDLRVSRSYSSPSLANLAASEPRGDATLVQDPVFWNRFSQALQEVDTSQQSGSVAENSPLAGKKEKGVKGKKPKRDSWLQQQKREKRRCRLICFLVTAIAAAIIAAVVVVLVVVLKV